MKIESICNRIRILFKVIAPGLLIAYFIIGATCIECENSSGNHGRKGLKGFFFFFYP